jgi:hypothetical protein
LKKKIDPGLLSLFGTAIARRLEKRSWPVTIGCLLQRKKPLLFLLSDLQASSPKGAAAPAASTATAPRPSPPVAPSRELIDFARLFEEAFDRLERQRGHNFVSLVDLRRVLATDRETFDNGLQSLRRAGRYTLSGAEGRDGISQEENVAGIHEEGSLLLYVSRRLS